MKKETINDLTTEKTELKREIGAFGGVSIIAGIMIGSGIFYLGAYVLQRVGMNSGLALLCWIIGGVISLFGGLAYAEMGAAMLFNVLIVLAVPILRKKFPNIERPYKVWLYPVSIIFTSIVFLALFVNSAIENPILGSIGFTVPALGAVVYLIFDRKLKKEAGENKETNDG